MIANSYMYYNAVVIKQIEVKLYNYGVSNSETLHNYNDREMQCYYCGGN